MDRLKTDKQLTPLLEEGFGRPNDRIQRIVTLAPGQFWRATKDAKDDEGGSVIQEGRMHMIRDVKEVDGVVHAVVLRGHPSECARYVVTYSYLLKNFMNCFEHIEDYQAIRDAEIAGVQTAIERQQKEMERLGSDPNYAVHLLLTSASAKEDSMSKVAESPLSGFDHDAGLPGSNISLGTSIQAVTQGDVEKLRKQVENQQIITQARANLIQSNAENLSKTVNELAPYYTERADAMVAAASGAIKLVKQVQQGLHTLELYTGTEVEVVTIRKGRSAPAGVKYALRQRLLYMDIESLIQSELEGADFRDFGTFSKMLCEDQSLLERVMPEERCILSMKYRRSHREYNDNLLNAHYNTINKESFLLLRDGENLYGVFSPLTYVHRLFPSKDDGERPFRGVRGERITVDDVNYVDAREELEKTALMYRRLLIMLWGLHDRTDIFGPLKADEVRGGHANLLSADVQDEVFNFIYDDEPEMMLGENRPGFAAWVEAKNAKVQPGSRVLIRWAKVMTVETAPSCFSEGYGPHGPWEEQRYKPKDEWGLVILGRKGKDLIARVQVEGYSPANDSRREFVATVTLPGLNRLDYNSMLCVDDVAPEEIMCYINSRTERINYLEYIPLFMDVHRQVVKDEADAADMRDDICEALQQGCVANVDKGGVMESVSSVIRQYRVAHRWASIPAKGSAAYARHLEKVLGQLWVVFGKGGDRAKRVEEMMEGEGRQPLRLVVTGRNHLVIYATAIRDELETCLGEHVWVQRIRLEEKKTKISVLGRRWCVLEESLADETVIHEWPLAAEWVGKTPKSHNLSYTKANLLHERMSEALENLAGRMVEPFKSDAEFRGELETLYKETMSASGEYVKKLKYILPVGVLTARGKNNYGYARVKGRHLALLVVMDRWEWLWMRSSEEQREDVKVVLDNIYRDASGTIAGLAKMRWTGCLAAGELADAKDVAVERLTWREYGVLTEFDDRNLSRQRENLSEVELTWVPSMNAFEKVLGFMMQGSGNYHELMMDSFKGRRPMPPLPEDMENG